MKIKLDIICAVAKQEPNVSLTVFILCAIVFFPSNFISCVKCFFVLLLSKLDAFLIFGQHKAEF